MVNYFGIVDEFTIFGQAPIVIVLWIFELNAVLLSDCLGGWRRWSFVLVYDSDLVTLSNDLVYITFDVYWFSEKVKRACCWFYQSLTVSRSVTQSVVCRLGESVGLRGQLLGCSKSHALLSDRIECTFVDTNCQWTTNKCLFGAVSCAPLCRGQRIRWILSSSASSI